MPRRRGSVRLRPRAERRASRAGPGRATAGSYQRIWSAEIPSRNPNFTGRVTELETLLANLTFRGRPIPPAQVISGMGGVGKTEIATEYIHRHRDRYDIVLVDPGRTARPGSRRASQPGRTAGIAAWSTSGGRDRAIAAVLEALDRGSGRTGCWSTTTWRSRWICSGTCRRAGRAATSSSPRGCRPGPATSRRTALRSLPFTEEEAVSFLRHRVPALGADRGLAGKEDEQRNEEAGRLAAALGHLPIAIEHAAAYLTETSQSVDDYLSRFDQNAHRLLSEQRPGAARVRVAHLDDVHRAAHRRRRAPVQPVRVLLPGADRGRTATGERPRGQRSARAARVPVLLAPVPRRGEPDAPAVPGQGGRGPRPDPDAPGGPGGDAGPAAAAPARCVPGLPGGRRHAAGRVEPG